MAKEKSNKAEQEKALQNTKKAIEKYLEELGGNFQGLKAAEFALRQIVKNGSWHMNVVVSDKDFTKHLLGDVQAIDSIQGKLVSRMGDPNLIENLQRFTEGLELIKKTNKEFINSFLEKGIGNGKDLDRFRKESAQNAKTAKVSEVSETPVGNKDKKEKKEETSAKKTETAEA